MSIPIATIDVSRLPELTGMARLGPVLRDTGLALLLVLMIPVGIMIALAPLAMVAWAVRAVLQR
jgi:hypothetical protein